MYEEQTKKESAHRLLNVIWGILTTICLLLVLYFIWNKEKLAIQHELQNTAEEISDRVDRLIENLGQSINKMPIHGYDFIHCEEDVMPVLQRLVFRDPIIAGIIITNSRHKVVCGTLPRDTSLPALKKSKSIGLVGPVRIKSADKSAFVLQQQLGKYSIEIYMLQHELERKLETASKLAHSVALYNKAEGKTILQITRNKHHAPWFRNNHYNYLDTDTINHELGKSIFTNHLIGLSNIDIILLANQKKLNHIAVSYSIAAGILILILSITIYFYLRRLIYRHYSLHRALVNAIKQHAFYPTYQPLLDRRNSKCCGAEVLLRWNANNQEVIMPDNFIEYAEESGLIIPITLQLAETVFKECQSLLKRYSDIHLSINISSIHFSDATFLTKFLTLCEEYDINKKQIMLELTERDLLQEDATLINKMLELRDLGFSMAIDDFGTGHASISYLQHFPFNYLKIDKIFVSAIGTGAITERLNQTIIHMAKELKLHVIAEGVETYQQLQSLEKQGVYLIQGWYFAKAMPFDAFKQFLKRNS